MKKKTFKDFNNASFEEIRDYFIDLVQENWIVVAIIISLMLFLKSA